MTSSRLFGYRRFLPIAIILALANLSISPGSIPGTVPAGSEFPENREFSKFQNSLLLRFHGAILSYFITCIQKLAQNSLLFEKQGILHVNKEYFPEIKHLTQSISQTEFPSSISMIILQ
jgi:hypothetical protein